MTDDLRARYDPAPVPPPDLADRAMRTARGIVARRMAAGALAVAAVVVAPIAVLDPGGSGGTAAPAVTRTATPTATPTASPGSPRPLPSCAGGDSTFEVPHKPADVAWPYRGDPALRPAAVEAGRGLAKMLPLFAARLPDGSTIAAAGGVDGVTWELHWRWSTTGAVQEDFLPVLGPDAVLGAIVATGPPVAGVAATLVVLAAPGTTDIAYTSCRDDGGRRYAAAGDTAVIPLRPRDLTGIAEAGTPSGPLAAEQVSHWFVGPGAYPVEPLPVPAGHREIPDVVRYDRAVEFRGAAPVRDARVFYRCAPWAAPVVARIDGTSTPLRCDNRTRIAADGLTLVPGRRVLDLSGARLSSVSVLVAVPER
jgi:hypothetical protein